MGKWWAKMDFLFFPIGFQSWQPDCWYFHTLLMAMESLCQAVFIHIFSVPNMANPLVVSLGVQKKPPVDSFAGKYSLCG